MAQVRESHDELFDHEFEQETELLPEHEKQFNKTSVMSISDLETDAFTGQHITTYLWKDTRYPIPSKETVTYLAKHVINHNRNNGFTLGVAIGKSGCVIAGTRVMLADGSEVPIETLGQFHEQRISVQVRSGLEPDKSATATTFFKFENQKVVQIKTASGRGVTGTYDHPLFVRRGHGIYEWAEMKDLQVGDEVRVIPANSDCPEYAERIIEIHRPVEPVTVYDIEVQEAESFVANRIISHNTGKTTLVTTLLHRIHKFLEKLHIVYTINWFQRDDVAKIDSIIPTFQKGVNRIIIFDDASWGDRDLSDEEVQNLMARLTYIRHDLQANVVVIMIMHYSKALGPFLRDGDFAMVTSISPIEKENYYKLFGWENKFLIKKFFTKYGAMNANGYYYTNLDESNVIVNYTKRPFKLALVNDFNTLHLLNYPEESCAYCEKRIGVISKFEYKESGTEKELYHDVGASYGPTILRQVTRYLFFTKGGADVLEPRYKSVWHRMVSYYEKHPADFENTLEELKRGKSINYVLRSRGVEIGEITREEKRREKRKAKAEKEKQRYKKEKEDVEEDEKKERGLDIDSVDEKLPPGVRFIEPTADDTEGDVALKDAINAYSAGVDGVTPEIAKQMFDTTNKHLPELGENMVRVKNIQVPEQYRAPSREALEAAGVPGLDPGPMNDEDLGGSFESDSVRLGKGPTKPVKILDSSEDHFGSIGSAIEAAKLRAQASRDDDPIEPYDGDDSVEGEQ